MVAEDLAAGDGLADAVDENLPAPPGQRAEPRAGQPFEHLPQRTLRDLGERVNLRRREAVHVDLGEVRLDVPEQVLVPLQRQGRMHAPLEQDLVAPHGHRLVDLP